MKTKQSTKNAPAVQSRGAHPWLKLAMAIVILAGVIFVAGPLGLRLPGYRQMDRFIAERGLKATAIYYTDLEEFAQAESAIRDGMRYTPDKSFLKR